MRDAALIGREAALIGLDAALMGREAALMGLDAALMGREAALIGRCPGTSGLSPNRCSSPKAGLANASIESAGVLCLFPARAASAAAAPVPL